MPTPIQRSYILGQVHACSTASVRAIGQALHSASASEVNIRRPGRDEVVPRALTPHGCSRADEHAALEAANAARPADTARVVVPKLKRRQALGRVGAQTVGKRSHVVYHHSTKGGISAEVDVIANDVVAAATTLKAAGFVASRVEERLGLVVVNGPEEAVDDLCVDKFGERCIAESGSGGAGYARSRGRQEGQRRHKDGRDEHIERSLCFTSVEVPE